jgi:peptide/nickel transport system ATP-binding protein
MSHPAEAILSIRDLSVHLRSADGPVRAVDGISLDVRPGETLGLVGESGCGKSITALAIMRLIDKHNISQIGGQILLYDDDLLGMSGRQMRAVRGRRIAMIFQEPMTSLNPVMRIGGQISESLIRHRKMSARAAGELAVELLYKVGIPSPRARAGEFPHQLSGGMRQRAMIALAIACEPELLIADEPTTALDVTIQAQILQLIDDLKSEFGMGVLLITHNFGVVAQTADRTAVMYAGRIVEQAPTVTLFDNPRHPYTRGLLRSMPRLGQRPGEKRERLEEIPGDRSAAIAATPLLQLRAALQLQVRALLRGAARHHRSRRGTYRQVLRTAIHPGSHGLEERPPT